MNTPIQRDAVSMRATIMACLKAAPDWISTPDLSRKSKVAAPRIGALLAIPLDRGVVECREHRFQVEGVPSKNGNRRVKQWRLKT